MLFISKKITKMATVQIFDFMSDEFNVHRICRYIGSPPPPLPRT